MTILDYCYTAGGQRSSFGYQTWSWRGLVDVGMGGEPVGSGGAKLAPGDVAASLNLEAASSMHPLLVITLW